nr:DUF6543 domain-containing protein [Pandoraea terrae]
MAGRIGRQATALMRTVLTLPSASQRQESDGGVDGVDVYRIGVSVPGQTELLYPAGMFVVSQRAGARSVLFTPGGAVPFRDYATLHALVGDLARDGTSSARRHLLECLPLRHRAAASAEGARIVLTIERENILSVVTRTNCAVIQDDLAFSAEAVAEGAREQRWLSWFTAVPFETSARVPGADAAFIGFSGGVPPDLPPRQECVRFDDRAVEQLRHLNQMRADIVAAAPSVREVATQYVASLMQAHVGKHVDVERIGLSLLLIDRSPESDVQSHKEIVIPLPAVVMIRLEEGGLPLNALSRARFQLPPGKDGKPDDLAGLTPGALFRRIDVVQYRETLRRRFDAFLSEQSRQIREVLKGSYIVEANTGAFARRLGAPAMAMALAVANVEPSAPLELSGLARTDIDAPQHVRVAWLSLNGYRSDILTLTDRNTGVVVFYDAWSRGPRFKEFPDWDAAQRWCHDQVSSEEKRIRLESAFSLRRGTESAMDFSAYIRGTQITDDAGVWQIRPDRVDIDGDVFDAIFNTFRRRLTGAFEVSAAEEIHPLGGFQKVLLALNLAIGAASFFMAPLSQAAIGLAAFQLALGGALALFADTPAEKSVAANFAVGGLVGGSVSLSALIARNVSAMGGLNAFRSSTSSSDMAPALPGLYHHDSRLYAQVRDHVYGVAYDTDVRSWRMVDQATQLASGPLLELGGDFEWYLSEIQSPVEAQSSWGGNVLPDPATVVVGAKFESKATALRTASNQLKRDAFLDGVQAGKQIALPSPQTRRASGLLQLDFLDPATTDPRELGMLYQRFVATRAAELAEKAVVAANLLRADVALLGGQFLPLPQAPYLASVGAQRGFCLPLCRAMAVALYRRKTADWVRTLDAAITAPQTERAMALKADLIALHSHAGIAAAQESVGLREFSEVTDMISALSSPNQMFLMSTVEHSMLFGTCLDRTGALNYFFYDPNFGVISHRHADVLSQLMEDHLIGRQMATQYGAYMIGNACGFEVRALRLDTLANASLCSTTVGGLIKVKAAPAVLAGQGSRAAV